MLVLRREKVASLCLKRSSSDVWEPALSGIDFDRDVSVGRLKKRLQAHNLLKSIVEHCEKIECKKIQIPRNIGVVY